MTKEQSIMEKKAPSLVDLCVRKAIDNLKFLGDVGDTDLHLLRRILWHCTVDQLVHVEKSSAGRDLSPVTDMIWKGFYERKFGRESTNLVIERMREKKVAFRWMQLYEAKSKVRSEVNNILDAERLKLKRMRKEAGTQDIGLTKNPLFKRMFYGGGTPSYKLVRRR